MTLTRDDLSVIEGDARVSCRRLAEVLGFNRHNDVHRLIKQRWDELEDFGGIFCFTAKKSGRGRPTLTYYLNEHQAVALCMWADTARARAARMQIVEVFVAWRRGDLHALAARRQHGPDVLRPAPKDAFEAGAARAEVSLRYLRSLSGIDEFMRELTHLPIWSEKVSKRPRWWHDLEVREFLTVTHRQMQLIQVETEGRKLFGSRCPRKSAIHVYWQRLDMAKRMIAARVPDDHAVMIARQLIEEEGK